jgi:uncharacterized repeat protein (TIGR03803 family)
MVLTTLYSFTDGNDGGYPMAGLVQGSDGHFYGTTSAGGAKGFGTVFKISAAGALSTLYSFTNGNDGASPSAGLVQGSDGNFYGTASNGGKTNIYAGRGLGTVFKISASGALTTLHSFNGTNADGANPSAGLVLGSDGNFYGTTGGSGVAKDLGTVFQISAAGALSTLYSFTGGNDGEFPLAALVQGSDGSFYGTASNGGKTNINAGRGWGTVFKISASGALTSLYSFTGLNDGGNPLAGLVQGSDGNFYGTTYGGFFNGSGTVFQISAAGALSTLYSFTNGNDGANPYAGLVQGSDGNFYGTTSTGGAKGFGTVFQISAAGALSTLYSFTNGNDGEQPQAALVQGSDGNFYGTTFSGGQGRYGTVFRLSVGLAGSGPQLAIIPSGANVILTWPTNGTSFVLQQNSDLSTTNWMDVTTPVGTVNGQYQVTLTPSGDTLFYRLKSQ